ncbi:hypothetical protein OIU85_005504 [Salix viminalis]|uniref:Uncharacterized protein n=1 Tax=Salix viminalis TaxID=40686 RepID=A0A9Q0SU30_SALVM|nr:hypothetical protein OIU85_005504 [Salix viminalis]
MGHSETWDETDHAPVPLCEARGGVRDAYLFCPRLAGRGYFGTCCGCFCGRLSVGCHFCQKKEGDLNDFLVVTVMKKGGGYVEGPAARGGGRSGEREGGTGRRGEQRVAGTKVARLGWEAIWEVFGSLSH